MEPKIVVNGKDYPLPDSFTLGESADMEKITGQGYDLSQGGALGLLAIAYVAVRRLDASVTVDDIRVLTADDIEVVQEDTEPLPPPVAAGSTGNEESSSGDSRDDSMGSLDETLDFSGMPV